MLTGCFAVNPFVGVSKWNSQQNIQMILNFTLKLSKIIYDLAKKWDHLNVI